MYHYPFNTTCPQEDPRISTYGMEVGNGVALLGGGEVCRVYTFILYARACDRDPGKVVHLRPYPERILGMATMGTNGDPDHRHVLEMDPKRGHI